MPIKVKHIFVLLFVFCSIIARAQDEVADNMLLHQRKNGGWSKFVDEVKVDYNKKLSPAEKSRIAGYSGKEDATIDNSATTKEIRYLASAYKKWNNKKYLEAAEKGIRYLLKMQYPNGGFPQYYPDASGYRSQVTYNDHAMINALNVLWDVIYRKNDLDATDTTLIEPSKTAVARGIDCILKTQIIVGGVITAWCTQYDKTTMLPAKARAFELPSIASAESVGIVEFLMKIEKPGPQIKNAITAAVGWLKRSSIEGYTYVDIKDSTQPKGTDRVLVPDKNSVVWARFYDIETNRPMFAGRDGIKRWSLTEIENERRVGYAWYVTTPKKLLDKEYPAWLKKYGSNSMGKSGNMPGIYDYKFDKAAVNTRLEQSMPEVVITGNCFLIKNGRP